MANIILSWDSDVSNPDYYEIRYTKSNNISYSYITTTNKTLIISGLEDNVYYIGSIRTVKDNVFTDWVDFDAISCVGNVPVVTPTITLTPTLTATPTPTPTVSSSPKPFCQYGPVLISVTNVSQTGLTYTYTGTGITSISYKIKQNNTVLNSGTTSVSGNTVNLTYTSLSYGSYTLEITGNNCISIPSTLNFSVGQMTPNFTGTTIQANCYTNTTGKILLSGITNGDRYRYCNSSGFTCSNDCSSPDGYISGGTLTFDTGYINGYGTQYFTIRVYNGSNCTLYRDYIGTINEALCTTNGTIDFTPRALYITLTQPALCTYTISLQGKYEYNGQLKDFNIEYLFTSGTTTGGQQIVNDSITNQSIPNGSVITYVTPNYGDYYQSNYNCLSTQHNIVLSINNTNIG